MVLQALADHKKHPIECTWPNRIKQMAPLLIPGNLRNAKQGQALLCPLAGWRWRCYVFEPWR